MDTSRGVEPVACLSMRFKVTRPRKGRPRRTRFVVPSAPLASSESIGMESLIRRVARRQASRRSRPTQVAAAHAEGGGAAANAGNECLFGGDGNEPDARQAAPGRGVAAQPAARTGSGRTDPLNRRARLRCLLRCGANVRDRSSVLRLANPSLAVRACRS